MHVIAEENDVKAVVVKVGLEMFNLYDKSYIFDKVTQLIFYDYYDYCYYFGGLISH